MFDYTYPHTNLSDINLDWFLKRFSELESEFTEIKNRMSAAEEGIENNRLAIEALQTDFNDLLSAFERFKDDVSTQFDSLEASLRAAIEAAILDMQDAFEVLKAEIEAELDTLKEDLEEDMRLLTTQIMATIRVLESDIDNFKIEIRGALDTLLIQAKVYTDGIAADLQEQIDELADMGVHTDVTDPTDRGRKHLQPALDRMHEYLRAWALTAAEYLALNLTAEEYAAYDLTAYEYGYRGKWHLVDLPYIKSLIV